MDQNQTSQPNPAPQAEAPKQALPSGDLTPTHKILACACYFVFFIPIFFDKEKTHPFVVHHMNQGFGVFIVHLAYMIVASFYIIHMFSFIIGIFSMVLAILGIISAAQGQMKKLPVVGNFNVFHS